MTHFVVESKMAGDPLSVLITDDGWPTPCLNPRHWMTHFLSRPKMADDSVPVWNQDGG